MTKNISPITFIDRLVKKNELGQLRIPTQIDIHSAGKPAPVPIEIDTCSDANRQPYLG